MTPPRRPVLRYHGGKWKIAQWVASFFPPHRIYVEPFGGAASVLMRKPRSYAEVYNDLDDEVVNVFRILRSPGTAGKLRKLLEMTPFARSDYVAAYEPCADRLEQARRTIIKSFMGFGSNAIHDARPRGMRTSSSLWRPPSGFRSNSERSGTTPAHDWRNYPAEIPAFVERLQGVVIEARDGFAVMLQHDSDQTLHYVDPPYLLETRVGLQKKKDHGYLKEFATEAQHVELATILHSLQGMVVLSGYPSNLYDGLYAGWRTYERQSLADRAAPRLEVLWLSPRAAAAHDASKSQLELAHG